MNQTKKKFSRKKIIAITGGLILTGSIAAFAGGKAYWHHGNHMSHAVDHISDDLKLSDTQRNQLESLGTLLMDTKKTLRKGNEVDIILSSVQGDALDREALNAMIIEKLDAVRMQSPVLVASVADFYDGLNSEQQFKARSKMEKMAEWSKDHRHDH